MAASLVTSPEALLPQRSSKLYFSLVLANREVHSLPGAHCMGAPPHHPGQRCCAPGASMSEQVCRCSKPSVSCFCLPSSCHPASFQKGPLAALPVVLPILTPGWEALLQSVLTVSRALPEP